MKRILSIEMKKILSMEPKKLKRISAACFIGAGIILFFKVVSLCVAFTGL